MNKIKLNIQGKKVSLAFNKHFTYLVKINESLNFGAKNHYQKQNLTYVDVPEIVGITGACENIDTLFKIQNNLDLPLFFTQTGQLSLEQSLQFFNGVYTVIHSGRDEEKEDKRHLRQFLLTEEEFDSRLVNMNRKNYDEEKMFKALLEHIQKTIQAMIRTVLRNNKNVLINFYNRNIDELEKATQNNFLQIGYKEAVKLLNKRGFKNLKFGDDLKSDHEEKIVKLLNKRDYKLPVFITKYPKEIKFFNMKVSNKNPNVVLSADLIFPYAGEGVGSAVREYDFNKLNKRLIESTMYKFHIQRGGKYKDFKWYLDIIKNKNTFPHAGYGIGNERVLQYIFAESDIRNVSLFSLLNNQTGDWDREKYGYAAIITDKKKHILLSIGKIRNKKLLLPYIKKLSRSSRFILYATQKTYLFLKKQKVVTNLVHKISESGQKPNIFELLDRRTFDLIINIPTKIRLKKGKEFSDGKLIRKGAIQTGVNLITNIEVARIVIQNLTK